MTDERSPDWAEVKGRLGHIESTLTDIDGRLSHIEQDGLKDEVHDNTRRIGVIENAVGDMKPVLDKIDNQLKVIFGTGKTLLVLLGVGLTVLQIVAIIMIWLG